ncbi:MAG: molybdenum cofactor guanylyltransferase [Halobacteriaceae archaeon]
MSTGVIIAGGRSTRFGDADKAVADLAGEPMIRRVADRIAPAVNSLVVNCRAEQVPAIRDALDGFDPGFAEDPEGDRGPMAGIRNGLRAAPAEYAFVVACDMPFVDPDFAAYLLDRAQGRDAAVPRPDDWFQTTQAVYRAAAMADACDRALDRGDGKIIDALFETDYVVVEADEIEAHAEDDTFDNVNTRAELDAVAERL